MTVQKSFKRLVRARMAKTGERYTAARAQLLAGVDEGRYADREIPQLACSDERIRERTDADLPLTAFLDGVHGDTDATYLVGDVDEESKLLVERTQEALRRGIKVVAPGRQINVIGRVIESYAKRFGYGVVRECTGHGINTSFHSGLIIPHYDDPRATTVMQPGMTFTIEPMLTLGTHEYDMWDDGWTVTTKDKSWTAQFEHTMVVTDEGAEILTLP